MSGAALLDPIAVATPAQPRDFDHLQRLHPALWLGHQLGRVAVGTVASGFTALDAALPGNGWPCRCLTELLLPHHGIGELRLLAPALAAAQRQSRIVMFFDPPGQLAAAVLVSFGIALETLLIVNTRARVIPGSDSLWALEQALKSGHVGAVFAWLPPRLHAERLRRLQLAAHQHNGVAFVVREMKEEARPSASPLRCGGVDRLQLRVVKRRGPPLAEPLMLDLPPVLSRAARQRSERSAAVSTTRNAAPA